MNKYYCLKDLYLENGKLAFKKDNIYVKKRGFFMNEFNQKHTVTKSWNKYFVKIKETLNKVEDKVNHPSHYTWLKEKCGIEVIDITRHLDFDSGNAVKYILRAGYKSEEGYSNKEKQIEDFKKAIWYLNDKLKMLENE